MCRTKSIVNSGMKFDLKKRKSTRHLVKLISRKARHGLRNQNRYADQLHFVIFKRSPHRKAYKPKSYQEERQIFGTSLGDFGDKLRRNGADTHESMRKRLQDELRKMRRQKYKVHLFGLRQRPRTESDVFIAAHKRFKRRGSMEPFQGHREKGVLYKRQLAYWM